MRFAAVTRSHGRDVRSLLRIATPGRELTVPHREHKRMTAEGRRTFPLLVSRNVANGSWTAQPNPLGQASSLYPDVAPGGARVVAPEAATTGVARIFRSLA